MVSLFLRISLYFFHADDAVLSIGKLGWTSVLLVMFQGLLWLGMLLRNRAFLELHGSNNDPHGLLSFVA